MNLNFSKKIIGWSLCTIWKDEIKDYYKDLFLKFKKNKIEKFMKKLNKLTNLFTITHISWTSIDAMYIDEKYVLKIMKSICECKC